MSNQMRMPVCLPFENVFFSNPPFVVLSIRLRGCLMFEVMCQERIRSGPFICYHHSIILQSPPLPTQTHHANHHCSISPDDNATITKHRRHSNIMLSSHSYQMISNGCVLCSLPISAWKTSATVQAAPAECKHDMQHQAITAQRIQQHNQAHHQSVQQQQQQFILH